MNVVILARDRTPEAVEISRQCLESISLTVAGLCRLVVVDQASCPEFARMLDDYLSDADIYVRNDANVGVASGRNQGLRLCSEDIITFADNDVVFCTQGWDNLFRERLYDDGVDIVAPLTNFTSCESQQSDGSDLSDSFVSTHFVPGLCMSLRRSTTCILGPFDERFSPYGYEDTDYCMRASIHGLRIVVTRNVFVRHQSQLVDKGSDQGVAGAESFRRYQEKWDWM